MLMAGRRRRILQSGHLFGRKSLDCEDAPVVALQGSVFLSGEKYHVLAAFLRDL
jgi:hypothetical protein